MEKSKLRSSGRKKIFFMFWSRLAKSLLKKRKGTDSHLSDGDPFEKKLNAHGVKKGFA